METWLIALFISNTVICCLIYYVSMKLNSKITVMKTLLESHDKFISKAVHATTKKQLKGDK